MGFTFQYPFAKSTYTVNNRNAVLTGYYCGQKNTQYQIRIELGSMTWQSIKQFTRGTTTPLASIFGSGFLVIVSVLAGAVGAYALIAMAGICILAYLVGSVVRFNIRHAETVLASANPPAATKLFERIADVVLVPAYVISITLYLRILSSYGLGYLDADSEYNERSLTTGIIVFILFVSVTKGLKVLEGLEKWALYTTMAIIALLIVAFAVYDIDLLISGSLTLPAFPDKDAWHIITVLAGTLIVVQGFETTRYLGDEYDRQTRIRACRNSQIIATVVYLLFILLATPLMHFLSGEISDNSLMQLAHIVAIWLPAPLVLAAIFSQFSAATADTIGASGNMLEFSNHKITEKISYIIICGFAIVLTWTADTLQILALASRAFAFYYFMQCLVALTVTDRTAGKIFFVVIAMILLFITVFAVPVG